MLSLQEFESRVGIPRRFHERVCGTDAGISEGNRWPLLIIISFGTSRKLLVVTYDCESTGSDLSRGRHCGVVSAVLCPSPDKSLKFFLARKTFEREQDAMREAISVCVIRRRFPGARYWCARYSVSQAPRTRTALGCSTATRGRRVIGARCPSKVGSRPRTSPSSLRRMTRNP